jgi:hypothetical protein
MNEPKIMKSEEAIERLLTWDKIDSAACDKLFEKKLFQNIRFPLGKYNEDIFVIPKIIHLAGELIHIGLPKYNYCHRPNSITTEGFSEKKMDLIYANEEVVTLVNDNYPKLKLKAQGFYFKGVIYLAGLLKSKSRKKKHVSSYNFIINIFNNYFFIT